MKISSLLIAVLLGSGLASAQGYYDDDIYFDASKAKKATTTAQSARNKYYGSYPAADTYTPEGGSTRSVDEYNRRGIFAVPHATDTISVDSLIALGDFSYTRRIERFHNPDVVIENPDKSIAEVYYSEGNPPEINIYVNTPGYWGYPYSYGYDPFWGPGWGWGPSWAWGSPYWSWNWGWGPSWSWSWAWGPSWNWGWGPGWGWGGPAWGWAPSIPTPPAQGRPINGVRPGGDTHYAGSYRRASGSSSSRWNISNLSGRPSAGSMSRPTQGSNGTQYRPGANGSYRNGTASRNDNNNSRSYRREQNNNYNNYNNSSFRNNSNSGGSYRSSGSMGGSMRSGAGSAGSMRGGGGGASRGGRR